MAAAPGRCVATAGVEPLCSKIVLPSIKNLERSDSEFLVPVNIFGNAVTQADSGLFGGK